MHGSRFLAAISSAAISEAANCGAPAQTVVRTIERDSKAFNVKVGLHQGSFLSLLLFVIVTEMISRELRAGLPLVVVICHKLKS